MQEWFFDREFRFRPGTSSTWILPLLVPGHGQVPKKTQLTLAAWTPTCEKEEARVVELQRPDLGLHLTEHFALNAGACWSWGGMQRIPPAPRSHLELLQDHPVLHLGAHGARAELARSREPKGPRAQRSPAGELRWNWPRRKPKTHSSETHSPLISPNRNRSSEPAG